MDESASILIAAVIGVLLIATLMFFYVPDPSNAALITDSRFDVAILAFRNSSTWRGIEETVRSRIEAKLANAPAIDVFSRAELDTLLMERTLDIEGSIDPATAAEIGSLTGVNKLITGSVYAVDTRSEETTMCVEWAGGQCVTRVPGVEYSVRVLAQVEVIDVRTGQIERAFDLDGADAVTLRAESTFGGFDSLLADAASDIAVEIHDTLTTSYFRELRYGLYREVEEKRGGYIGRDETDRFTTSDDDAHLVVHFTRMQSRETFDIDWVAPDGQVIAREQDIVGQGDWRVYTLDLSSVAAGRHEVRATLGGILAFREPFVVSP